ncbi:probable amino-acid acetyltransferase NAGS1, chloroplastic isoform X1, partial [Tanacetum coccineum]
TYEVATACALALGAEKLICIIDGPILQSEVSTNYVKAIGEESNSIFLGYSDFNEGAPASQNGMASSYSCIARFHNGIGFDNGNGLRSSEQGFATGGQERLGRSNGYLCVVAFVYRELFQRDEVGTMVASDLYEGMRMNVGVDDNTEKVAATIDGGAAPLPLPPPPQEP